jgi:tRNA(Ile2)-agmatinylcytidine synthase
MVKLHIGFDDTDSPRCGCTTYIAALLVEKFANMGVKFCDYPNLIRLNPNVPWKTRGNGALCLRIECDESVVDKICEFVADTVEANSDLTSVNTDPGVVFFKGHRIPLKIKRFAKNTIQGLVRMEVALKLIKEFHAEALGYGTGYGIVGALAAIGENLDYDHTYEVIAYRTPENRGSKRMVDFSSIHKMNREIKNQTFNNIDPETNRVLITPRGPDPILYGIRGETAGAVVAAHKMIKQLEPVERWVVFRTNQGTDAHLRRIKRIAKIQPFQPICFKGNVASSPRLIPKRHRVFSIKDGSSKVDCAVYEPTGVLRKAARELLVGDRIEACGGVKPRSSRHPLTVNLEKFRVLELVPKLELRNPICPECGKRMGSMGADQGFRCKKCGYQSSQMQKTFIEHRRVISEGLYITSPRSQRHLTKPFIRYGREKTRRIKVMIPDWHYQNPIYIKA